MSEARALTSGQQRRRLHRDRDLGKGLRPRGPEGRARPRRPGRPRRRTRARPHRALGRRLTPPDPFADRPSTGDETMPATAIDSLDLRATSSAPRRCAACFRTRRASSTTSTSRRRWRACRRASASFRRRPPRRSCRHCHAASSTCAARRPRPSASATRCSPVVQQLVGAVPGRARRMVPLGRDDPGHHRHRDGPADPRRARAGRAGPAGDRRRAGRARQPLPRHAHGRRAATCSRPCRSPSATRWPCCSPASSATSSGCASCARACWSASSAAPPATLSSLGARRARGPGRR